MITLYKKILILNRQGNGNRGSKAMTTQNEPTIAQVGITTHC